MRIGQLDTDERAIVIAEIGNNHEGDAALAERMIGAAAESGADAVKFQTIRADRLVGKVPPERMAMLRSFELSNDQFEHLARVAEREGVLFLSTPFDLESVTFLNDLVPAFKVASGDITFAPLLEAVAACAKPVIMSCGTADAQTVHQAVDTFRGVWNAKDRDPGLTLLHCVSMYPVEPHLANLSAIPALAEAFDLPVGYSDHTLGIEAAVLSVALGARVVEKHFTLDHHQSEFRDHQLSADPAELAEMVRRIRLAEAFLGSGSLTPSPAEAEVAPGMRRSLCAAMDLPAGTVISREHLTWLRPGGGLRPGREEVVLGKRLLSDKTRGEQLLGEDVE